MVYSACILLRGSISVVCELDVESVCGGVCVRARACVRVRACEGGGRERERERERGREGGREQQTEGGRLG